MELHASITYPLLGWHPPELLDSALCARSVCWDLCVVTWAVNSKINYFPPSNLETKSFLLWYMSMLLPCLAGSSLAPRHMIHMRYSGAILAVFLTLGNSSSGR